MSRRQGRSSTPQPPRSVFKREETPNAQQQRAATPGRIRRAFQRISKLRKTKSAVLIDTTGEEPTTSTGRSDWTAVQNDLLGGDDPPLAITTRPRLYSQGESELRRSRSAPRLRNGTRPSDNDEEAKARVRWARALGAVKLRVAHEEAENDVVLWPDRGEPDDVCTLEPVSSKRATLFLLADGNAEEQAKQLKAKFFPDTNVKSCEGVQLLRHEQSFRLLPGGSSSGSTRRFKSDARAVYSTIPPIATIEDFPGGHLYGPVVAITTNSKRGPSKLKEIFDDYQSGSFSLIVHDEAVSATVTMLGEMTLSRRTGVQKAITPDEPQAKSLATIFELQTDKARQCPLGQRPPGIGGNTVARCVVAYRDDSRWPSVGPTIRLLMVRRDFQGIGLAQQLFNEVEKWYVRNWKLSTLNGKRALKVTHLKDYIVDRNYEIEGVPTSLTTDKMFFYEVMKFKCINPFPPTRGGSALLKGYVPEAHAIKLYAPAGLKVSLPTVHSELPFEVGWRSCDYCRRIEEKPDANLVCSRCPGPVYWRAHYCRSTRSPVQTRAKHPLS